MGLRCPSSSISRRFISATSGASATSRFRYVSSTIRSYSGRRNHPCGIETPHRPSAIRKEEGAAIPTLFTKIINREIPAEIVYEDEHCIAFRDINPQAPVHLLIVPRQEIAGLASLPEDGDHRYLLNAARKIAERMDLTGGYRVVINEGLDAGQTVDHLHAHLLGGRKLGWPPG